VNYPLFRDAIECHDVRTQDQIVLQEGAAADPLAKDTSTLIATRTNVGKSRECTMKVGDKVEYLPGEFHVLSRDRQGNCCFEWFWVKGGILLSYLGVKYDKTKTQCIHFHEDKWQRYLASLV